MKNGVELSLRGGRARQKKKRRKKRNKIGLVTIYYPLVFETGQLQVQATRARHHHRHASTRMTLPLLATKTWHVRNNLSFCTHRVRDRVGGVRACVCFLVISQDPLPSLLRGHDATTTVGALAPFYAVCSFSGPPPPPSLSLTWARRHHHRRRSCAFSHPPRRTHPTRMPWRGAVRSA